MTKPRSNWQLSKASYYTDFFVVPIGAFISVYTWGIGNELAFVPLVLVGWMAWTFAEYAIHRWIEHSIEPYLTQHMLHHQDPAAYIGVSPLGTVPPIVVLGLVLPVPIYLGVLLGYYVYIWVHDKFHHGEYGSVSKLERWHIGHHKKWKTHFGVTTSLWDRVFGTFS